MLRQLWIVKCSVCRADVRLDRAVHDGQGSVSCLHHVAPLQQPKDRQKPRRKPSPWDGENAG